MSSTPRPVKLATAAQQPTRNFKEQKTPLRGFRIYLWLYILSCNLQAKNKFFYSWWSCEV